MNQQAKYILVFCLFLPVLINCTGIADNGEGCDPIGKVRLGAEILCLEMEDMDNQEWSSEEGSIWGRYVLDLNQIIFENEFKRDIIEIEEYYRVVGQDLEGEVRIDEDTLAVYRKGMSLQVPYLLERSESGCFQISMQEQKMFKEHYSVYEENKKEFDYFDEYVEDINQFLTSGDSEADSRDAADNLFLDDKTPEDAEEFRRRFSGMRIRNPWLVKHYFSDGGELIVNAIVEDLEGKRDSEPVMLTFSKEDERWVVGAPVSGER